MRYDNQLRYAVDMVKRYDGSIPLSAWLKDFFRKNKQMGSRDRKTVAGLVYAYYRLGHNRFAGDRERMLAGIAATQSLPELAAYFSASPPPASPEGEAFPAKPPSPASAAGAETCTASPSSPAPAPGVDAPGASPSPGTPMPFPSSASGESLSSPPADDFPSPLPSVPKPGAPKNELIASIFPWPQLLSGGIDPMAFASSFLIQPDLFLRIRPGREKIVYKKLADAGLSYYPAGNNGIGLPNSTSVENILEINRDVVVQDSSSQQTGELMRNAFDLWSGLLSEGSADGENKALPGNPVPPNSVGTAFYEVWDCCAASGGKSIMAYDLIGAQVHLTVSDVRETILQNLAKRLAQAGLPVHHSFVADLADPKKNLPGASFDLVIADVPCSGSGTWARVPERLYFFEPGKIGYYRQLQERIVSTVIPKIKAGGAFLYITCSAFSEENEGMVRFIQDHTPLTLYKTRLIKGYEYKADTMFAALFVNDGAGK